MDKLYRLYVEGDPVTARTALLDSLHFLDGVDRRAHNLAHGYWLSHARLYVLESAMGDDARAAVHFENARRYYCQQRREHGDSADELERSRQRFTETNCRQFVEEWDQKATDGRGARYLNAVND